LEYGEVSCKVNYYNSKGEIVESNDIFIKGIDAFGSESGMTHSSSNSVVSYKIVKDIIQTESLKSRVKEQIIRSSGYGCE
jgi:hypothetical protein